MTFACQTVLSNCIRFWCGPVISELGRGLRAAGINETPACDRQGAGKSAHHRRHAGSELEVAGLGRGNVRRC